MHVETKIEGDVWMCSLATMKQIRNLVSDAFVAARMDEGTYTVDIQSITQEESRVLLQHRETNERLGILILHNTGGFITSVSSFENTLFPSHGLAYTTILDTIYDAVYLYF
jgi:hypothetical protein